jgi:transketolase
MKTREISKPPMDDVTAAEAACQVLCDCAANDPSLWVLSADVTRTVKLNAFAQAFPDRFLNVGVAEQSMVGIAAGLATCGKLPVVNAFAAMLSMRACEQIRTDLAYNNLNVKIISSAAGVSAGYAGPTHHAIEDIAIMRAMPNMTVLVPCDARETREALRAALEWPGPVYIRIGGRTNDSTVYEETLVYQIGRAVTLRDGKDVTLIACGRTVVECVVAAQLLQHEGIEARVLDMHTVKPIDALAIDQAARQTRRVFTVEEHNVIGGLGGAVAEIMAELGTSTPLRRLGIPDVYAPIAAANVLLEKYGVTAPRIAEIVAGDFRTGTEGPEGREASER